jgi:hypothetical protein
VAAAARLSDVAEQDAAPAPGIAGMAQGQRDAGIEPVPQPEPPEAAEPEEDPRPPGITATGAEALEEQQKNPELEDSSGTRP